MVQAVGARPQGKILYVNKVDSYGWLSIRLPSGEKVPILEYTKVQLIETRAGRTFFTVQDGGRKGSIASMDEALARQYLGSKAPLQTGADVVVKYGKMVAIESIAKGDTFMQQTASLSIDGITALVTLNTTLSDPKGRFTPLPPGLYKILVPEYPHNRNYTSGYRDIDSSLRNDQVWFPIEYGDNSRFIHVGNISEGCITVMSLDKWNAIYQALIKHRVPRSKYLGQIRILK